MSHRRASGLLSAVARVKRTFAVVWLAFMAGGALLHAEPPREAIKWALGQIETGASLEGPAPADKVRGKNREVSRYQILPQIWARYAGSEDFTNPVHAWSIAQRILDDRRQWFQRLAGRWPDPFDLYVLWNAPGHYVGVGFVPGRVHAQIADRAERFASLVAVYGDGDLRAQN